MPIIPNCKCDLPLPDKICRCDTCGCIRTPSYNFELDDEVEAFGVKGRIIQIYKYDDSHSPLIVRFKDIKDETFTEDGRLCEWHKTPCLKIIKKAKKEKKKITLYRYTYKHGITKTIFQTSWMSETWEQCLKIIDADGNDALVKTESKEVEISE